MSVPTVADIRAGILFGEFDDHLDDIAKVVRVRQKSLVESRTDKVGDRLQFGTNVRPKYLQGVPVTVVGKKITNLVIQLDAPVGKYSTRPMPCSPSLLVPIP